MGERREGPTPALQHERHREGTGAARTHDDRPDHKEGWTVEGSGAGFWPLARWRGMPRAESVKEELGGSLPTNYKKVSPLVTQASGR